MPANFVNEPVVSGLDTPTAMVFVPDGRIFVTEKAGRVRVVKNGALLATPLIDISGRDATPYGHVNDFIDHGLLGIALDPDFATNRYLYLLFTYENDATAYDGFKTARLARYTLGTGIAADRADPATERVLLGTTVGTLAGGPPHGKPPGTPMTGSCNDFAPGTDCLPSESPSHSIGTVVFAPDGTLFVSVGDGAEYNFVDANAFRAQDLDSLAGKILRITTDGKGLSDNPFWDGNPDANRSKVWAYGLRNPFRFTLKPGTSTPFIGDVGWGSWEEVNVGRPGANFGWPCYEGNYVQGGYYYQPPCQAVTDPASVRFGLLSWNHNGFAASSIGGAFYTGTRFPAKYRGAYFYGDYSVSAIRTLTVTSDNTLAGGPDDFSTDGMGPVQFLMGPDEDMYYISIYGGAVRRIAYRLVEPIAQAAATPDRGAPPPLTVAFSSAGSASRIGGNLTYLWDFGDGSPPVTEANPTHIYAAQGTFTAVLTVTDSANNRGTAQKTITVGAAPVVTIASPAATDTYQIGSDTGANYDVSFSGSATEGDGVTPIPATNLRWDVLLHHCQGGICHKHFVLQREGVTGGSFTPAQHEDESYTEITLTARDSFGLTSTKSVTMQPRKVAITLTTDPPGLPVTYGSISQMTPFQVMMIVGAQRTIDAPSNQDYTFAAWSDGGTPQHTVVVGVGGERDVRTYTARYTALPPTITSVGPGIGPVAGGNRVTITGSRFGGAGSLPTVRFGGIAATDIVVAGDGMSLTAVVPPRPVGAVAVSVGVPGKPLATLADAYTYGEIAPRPPTRPPALATPPAPATPAAPAPAPLPRSPSPQLAPANATPNATPNPVPVRR